MKKSDKNALTLTLLGVLLGGALAYSIGLLVSAGYEMMRERFSATQIFYMLLPVVYLCFYGLVFMVDNLDLFSQKTEPKWFKLLVKDFVRVHKYPVLGLVIILLGLCFWFIVSHLGMYYWEK